MPDDLIIQARNAANHAYAPYSQFRVGAAVCTLDGSIFTGVNVENVVNGLSVCAERHAIANAVAHGHQSFSAIAIVGLDSQEAITPCGGCRQVMQEFFTQDTQICCWNPQTETTVEYRISQLLPAAFTVQALT